MTYDDVVSEVLNLRFDESWRGSAKSWVRLRFGRLWGANSWTFRIARDPCSTLAQNEELQGIASDVGIVNALYDNDGNELDWLPLDQFSALYYDPTPSFGTPCHFTVINNDVLLGPIPQTSLSGYLLVYERRLPPLVDTAEIPYLPADWHYVLVDGGIAHGLVSVNDPSWQDAEAVWMADLQALAGEYSTDQRGETIVWPTNEG